MDSFTLTMAFLMGLTGSLHCAGMCSPIVWVMPFQVYNGLKKAAAIALYHFGRISVYAGMALVLHSFRGLFDPKFQQYISLGLGSLLLLLGVLAFIPNNRLHVRLPWTTTAQHQLSKVMQQRGMAALAIAGMLNGLLPCGLVYMALSASMITNTAPETIAYMFAFGVGTLPMLVAITLLRSKLSFVRNPQFRKFVPMVVMFFGCLFVLRGMNLGIPYLSPKVEINQQGIHACCNTNVVKK